MIAAAPRVLEPAEDAWTIWLGERPGADAPGGAPGLGGLPEIARVTEGVSFRVFGSGVEKHATIAKRGNGTALFFGMLWNRSELAEQLAEGPSDVLEAPADDDAQLVLAAYRQWGHGFLDRIRGVFSLVILDREQRSLLCARDPMGMWPLFYASVPGGLALSTSIDALLRFPGVPRDVCRASLAIMLCSLNQRKDETFFAAIRRLPAGHVMHCRGGDRRIRRYWDPVPSSLPAPDAGQGDFQEFASLVDQAVGRCLQRGRPAIFLSGGIDSVSVAATATDLCRKQGLPLPKAFSLVYPDLQANEESIQRGVAAALGIEQVILGVEDVIGPEGFLAPALEISRRSASPTLTVWMPAYRRLARMARESGCECILTGGGGDEWLSNSPFLVADRIRSFNFRSVVQTWTVLRNTFRVPPHRLARVLLWHYGLRPLMGSLVAEALTKTVPGILAAKRRWLRTIPSWIDEDPALRDEIEDHLEPTIPPSSVGGFYLREVKRFLDHFLVATDMELQFEYERDTGLSLLQPLFDPDLLTMLSRIGPELLSETGRSKGPAREMLIKRFPDLGFGQQKKVHGTNYFRTVMMREGQAAWDASGGIPALSQAGLVDPERWSLTLQSIFGKNDPQELFQVWCVLSAETWLRSRTQA